jgi:hypothetical protein
MVTRVGWGSVAGKFSHGFLGTIVVDQRFAGGGGGN